MSSAPPLASVGLFCGSALGADPAYGEAATSFGRILAEEQVRLVYGGGGIGLMGAVARTAVEAGGRVLGVIPQFLCLPEVVYEAAETRIVASMHERKAAMADRSDAFLALPGGWGTWEEVLEATTWTQLGYHCKPVGVLDLDGYYQPLKQLLARAVDEGFVRESQRDLLLFDDDLDRLLARMAEVELPDITRWMTAP